MDHPLVRPLFDWSFSWHLNESARNEYNEDVNMIIIDIPILYIYMKYYLFMCNVVLDSFLWDDTNLSKV